jgi:hypothetical protein
MTDVTIEVGQRVGFWLRQNFKTDTAKSVARLLGCSPKTVEGWLSGSLPANRHMIQMIAKWGYGFIAFVFEPAAGTSLRPYALNQELQDLKAKMLVLEGALNAATENEIRTLADADMGSPDEARGGARR